MGAGYNHLPSLVDNTLIYLRANSNFNNGGQLFNHEILGEKQFTDNALFDFAEYNNKKGITRHPNGEGRMSGDALNSALSIGFTISFWFYGDPSDTTVWYRVVAKAASGLGIHITRNSSTDSLNIRTDTTQRLNYNHLFGAGVIDNQWHHVVILFEEDGGLKTYIDNQVDQEWNDTDYTSAGYETTAPLSFFRYGNTSYGIDFFMVHGKVLSETEIAKIYNATAKYYQ